LHYHIIYTLLFIFIYYYYYLVALVFVIMCPFRCRGL